jgi:hypothetical protein
MAGLLGIPFPNGLIPQAPFHTEALCVTAVVTESTDDDKDHPHGHHPHHSFSTRPTHVVEQRVSNLAQGLLTLGTMTGPLLSVLQLIPQGVLAGLFFIMGVQALGANGITAKLKFLFRDRSTGFNPADTALRQLPRRRTTALFVAIELLAFVATFAVTQTVAAVGFPLLILACIPVRALLLPRWFSPLELGILDAPTAGDFTMESVGGVYGGKVIDAPEGESGSGEEDGKKDGTPPAGGLFQSDHELAELGEISVGVGSPEGRGSMTRRRGSAVVRGPDEDIQTVRRGKCR